MARAFLTLCGIHTIDDLSMPFFLHSTLYPPQHFESSAFARIAVSMFNFSVVVVVVIVSTSSFIFCFSPMLHERIDGIIDFVCICSGLQ